MSIAYTGAREVRYNGDGATQDFAYLFKASESEIKVLDIDLTDPDNPVETLLVLTTDYTVTEDDEGGTVSLVAASENDHDYVIYSDTTLAQSNTFPQREARLNTTALEASLDKLTKIVQELTLKARRSILFDRSSETRDVSIADPTPGTILIWDDVLDRIVCSDLTYDSLLTAIEAAEANAVAAAAAAAVSEANAASSELNASNSAAAALASETDAEAAATAAAQSAVDSSNYADNSQASATAAAASELASANSAAAALVSEYNAAAREAAAAVSEANAATSETNAQNSENAAAASEAAAALSAADAAASAIAAAAAVRLVAATESINNGGEVSFSSDGIQIRPVVGNGGPATLSATPLGQDSAFFSDGMEVVLIGTSDDNYIDTNPSDVDYGILDRTGSCRIKKGDQYRMVWVEALMRFHGMRST